jgi:hypothetical protein
VVVKREVIEANKTTLWSAWRSLFKKDLTGPTLLEMSGNPHDSSGVARAADVLRNEARHRILDRRGQFNLEADIAAAKV